MASSIKILLQIGFTLQYYYMKQRGTYRVRRVFFFLVNRVEHQKRTQTATKWWPFGFVFGVQLGLRHTKSLINTVHIIISCWSSWWIHHIMMSFPYAIAYVKVIISWRLQHENRHLMIMCSVLTGYSVYRRPSWTPKTQSNDTSAVVRLRFWRSARSPRKKVTT